MAKKVCFNDEFYSIEELPLSVTNRAFRYGDGLFETMVMFDGEIPLIDLHFERLDKGVEFLKIEMPDSFTKLYLASIIHQLAKHNGNIKHARIRLQIFRSGQGLYAPEFNSSDWLLEMSELPHSRFLINKTGLYLGVYNDVPKAIHPLSNHKTTNCLIYVLAGIYKKESGFDDCLLLNASGNVVEAVSSNVFMVKDGVLMTPPVSEGCVDGVMRKKVLDLAKELDIEAIEKPLKPSDLLEATEIWLTNAIQGIRWAGFFYGRRFGSILAAEFTRFLNESALSK